MWEDSLVCGRVRWCVGGLVGVLEGRCVCEDRLVCGRVGVCGRIGWCVGGSVSVWEAAQAPPPPATAGGLRGVLLPAPI